MIKFCFICNKKTILRQTTHTTELASDWCVWKNVCVVCGTPFYILSIEFGVQEVKSKEWLSGETPFATYASQVGLYNEFLIYDKFNPICKQQAHRFVCVYVLTKSVYQERKGVVDNFFISNIFLNLYII